MSSRRKALQETLTHQSETIRRSFRWVEGEPGRGLFNLCKYGLSYKDMEWEVHGGMCAFFEDAYFGRNRIVPKNAVQPYLCLVPRGSLKTSIITIGGPIWISHLNDPDYREGNWTPPPAFNGKPGYNQRLLIGSEVERNSKRFLLTIQNHFKSNGVLHTYFGSMAANKREMERRWTSTELDNAWRTDSISKEANMTTTAIDAVVNSGHYDVGFQDDIIGERSAYSEVWRERAIENHRILQPLMEKPSILFYVGTLWHDLDVYSYFMDPEQSNEHTRFVVYRERSERTEEEIAVGKTTVFWPARYPQEVLDDMRLSMGPWLFSAQMNNEVIDQATSKFKKSYFEDTQFDLEQIRPRIKDLNIITTCDPAISEDPKACFAVIITCGWDHQGHCWILDLFRKRGVEPREYIEDIFRQKRLWNPLYVGLETTGFQSTYRFSADEMSRDRNEFIPFVELKDSKRRKELRIDGLEPLASQHRIHWQKQHFSIIEEFIRYPRGKYRDAIDALAYQLDLAFRAYSPTTPEDPTDPLTIARQSWERLGVRWPSSHGVRDFYRDA